MQIRQRTGVFLSGTLWLIVGFMLMLKGIRLLMAIRSDPTLSLENFSLVKLFLPLAGHVEQVVLCLVVLGLVLGTLKGRTVLTKAAHKMMAHIRQLPEPLPLRRLYPVRYYVLLGCMMSLGVIRRLTGIGDDVGGVVDLAIGCALIQGALVYYRAMTAPTCDTANGDKS